MLLLMRLFGFKERVGLHDDDEEEDDNVPVDDEDDLEVTSECLFELSRRFFNCCTWIELLGGVGGRRGMGQGTARGLFK